MMSEYRIVKGDYFGYWVEIRRWWWPFWVELDSCHATTDEATQAAAAHATGDTGSTVTYLGKFEDRDV